MNNAEFGRRFALGTFRRDDGLDPFVGVVVDDDYVIPAGAANGALNGKSMLDLLEDWDRALPLLRDVALSDASRLALSSLRTEAPLVPRQIICTGANYRKHVIELMVDQKIDSGDNDASDEQRRERVARMMDERAANGEPYAFPKLPSSVTGPHDPIVIGDSDRVDWELELGAVIGRRTRHASRETALEHIAGYTIINDVTRRDLVVRSDMKSVGTDWLRGKSHPTFAPLGPIIVPRQFVPDPSNLRITLKLNGQVMQDESTADMIFDVARQIEYVSRYVQLEPGDVIATGSPAGNGTHWNRFMQDGDEIVSTVEGLGEQRNRCVRNI